MEIEEIQQQFKKQYKYQKLQGKGNYSEVFQCQNKNGECVAIKVVNTSKIKSQILPYLLNEVELLKQSNNENVIKLYESEESNSKLFLVLEYCEMDMMKMMTQYYNNKIPEDLVIVILKQLMNGLHYLHENRIIHRDLKLENIGVVIKKEDRHNLSLNKQNLYDQIFKNASYKLLDLGIAKQLINKTTTKSLAGTIFNTAPEVLEGKDYAFEADIYSLGVCLYQMITGQYPYQSKTDRRQREFIKRQDAKFDVIENQLLRDVIQQMLQYDVDKRLTFQQLYKSKLIINSEGTTPSPLSKSLIINSQLYILDKSIIENQLISNQSEISIIGQIEPKSQNQSNQKLKEIDKPQVFENFKNSFINNQSQTNLMSLTQTFQIIEYPQEINKSKAQLEESKLQSDIEMTQLVEITIWENQKNICTLLFNLCNKLLNVIESDHQINQYLQFDFQFYAYLNYFFKLAELLFNQLQFEITSNHNYSTIKEYIKLKDTLEIHLLSEFFTLKQKLQRYQIEKFKTNQIIQINNQQTFADQQQVILQNTKTIFQSISKIFTNIIQYQDSLKIYLDQIYCSLILILADLAILRGVNQNVNTISDDSLIIQLNLQKCSTNPADLFSQLLDIMEQNQISIDEMYDIS